MLLTKRFTITISKAALGDIEIAKFYYDEQLEGLGKRFTYQVKSSINKLSTHPYFQVRYKNIRCAPVSKFPFLIHFSVNDAKKAIEIFAIIHTAKNPETYHQ